MLGRYTFALGSNEEAVRLSGVNVDRWKIAIYALGGGDLRRRRPAHRLAPQFRAAGARPGLRTGRDRRGGHRRHLAQRRAGTILGTIIGAFIMSVLTNGLRIMSVAQEWQIVVTGVIIILAVYVDMLRRKRA